jgi:hypothetical protein
MTDLTSLPNLSRREWIAMIGAHWGYFFKYDEPNNLLHVNLQACSEADWDDWSLNRRARQRLIQKVKAFTLEEQRAVAAALKPIAEEGDLDEFLDRVAG